MGHHGDALSISNQQNSNHELNLPSKYSGKLKLLEYCVIVHKGVSTPPFQNNPPPITKIHLFFKIPHPLILPAVCIGV